MKDSLENSGKVGAFIRKPEICCRSIWFFWDKKKFKSVRNSNKVITIFRKAYKADIFGKIDLFVKKSKKAAYFLEKNYNLESSAKGFLESLYIFVTKQIIYMRKKKLSKKWEDFGET